MSLKTGTREWSEHSRNIFIGCAHNCRYCYAAEMAVRYGRIKSRADWPKMVINFDVPDTRGNGKYLCSRCHTGEVP